MISTEYLDLNQHVGALVHLQILRVLCKSFFGFSYHISYHLSTAMRIQILLQWILLPLLETSMWQLFLLACLTIWIIVTTGTASSLTSLMLVNSCVTHITICGHCGMFSGAEIYSRTHRWSEANMMFLPMPVQRSMKWLKPTSPPGLLSTPCKFMIQYYAADTDSFTSNLKSVLIFGFRFGWLVNPARASPTNFSSTYTGAQRPVISCWDAPVIHVTFGTVESCHLINPTSSGRKTIGLTVLDIEFDLAWAYYCTVFDVSNLMLYTVGNTQSVSFSTYPASSCEFNGSLHLSLSYLIFRVK